MEQNNKIIHYCWFGCNPLPNFVLTCIESWKKNLPEYEIIEWNENNFDINCNTYVREAYESKKWAFVSDYVRLYALYNHGGIYLDTDVEITQNLNCFLNCNMFLGFEDNSFVGSAIIGAKKGNPIIRDLLSYYDSQRFINADGTLNMTTNVSIITGVLLNDYNLCLDNTYQKTDSGLEIFPIDYFYPKDFTTGKIKITNNTYAIHHFNASWWEESKIRSFKRGKILARIFGSKMGTIINSFINALNKYGIRGLIVKFAAIFR